MQSGRQTSPPDRAGESQRALTFGSCCNSQRLFLVPWVEEFIELGRLDTGMQAVLGLG